jgi:hypothetical protein
MKRLRRWMTSGLTVMPLVICVACGVLWIRSVSRCDSVGYTTRAGNTYTISTGPHVLVLDAGRTTGSTKDPMALIFAAMHGRFGGGIRVHSDKWNAQCNVPGTPSVAYATPNAGTVTFALLGYTNTWIPPAHRFLGFGYDSSQAGTVTSSRAEFPLLALMLVFAATPAVRFNHAMRRRRRRRLGHCLSCGYDLRASKDRCPECGTAISGQGEV